MSFGDLKFSGLLKAFGSTSYMALCPGSKVHDRLAIWRQRRSDFVVSYEFGGVYENQLLGLFLWPGTPSRVHLTVDLN